MNSFLYQNILLFLAIPAVADFEVGRCPFLGMNQLHCHIQAAREKQKTLFELNEKDDVLELVFKSPDFQNPELIEKKVVSLTKKYSSFNAIKALYLRAETVSAKIKNKPLKNGKTGVLVAVTQAEQSDKDYNVNYFQNQIVVCGELQPDKVSAELDKEQGTLKIMIPKNSAVVQIAETVVPIAFAESQKAAQ